MQRVKGRSCGLRMADSSARARWNGTMHRLANWTRLIAVVLLTGFLGGCDRASRDEQAQDSKPDAADPTRDAGSNPGQLVRFAGHTASIRFVTFSADGRRALTGSSGQVLGRGDNKLEAKTADDRSARVWDVATGREVARFDEHTQGIACGAISPDGSVAATA